jgi:putative nucleic acid binding protein
MSEDSSPPTAKSKAPWVIGAIAAGVLVFGLVCCGCPTLLFVMMGMGAKKHADDQTKQVEEQKPIEISANQLIQEYKDNEVKANNTYKGKVVQVTGTVLSVSEGQVALKSNTQFELFTVQCHFDDRQALTLFSSGNTVTIKGICDGMSITAIQLRKCKKM